MKGFVLDHRLYHQIITHLVDHLPKESCGLLGGRDFHASTFLPVNNSVDSAYEFKMDPVEQLKALQTIESSEMELVAIFHSHPIGPPYPSSKDILEFRDLGSVTLIGAPEKDSWGLFAFWIENSKFERIRLELA